MSPKAVTAALRTLFPRVGITARGAGNGAVSVTIPARSADELGVTRNPDFAAVWLSQRLGTSVTIGSVRSARRRDCSRAIAFTVTPAA
jgi:hypothetical protein